jgi:hypothetical protein
VSGSTEIEKLERLVAAPTKYEVTITTVAVGKAEDGTETASLVREKHVLWITGVKTGHVPKLIRATGALLPLLVDKKVDMNPVKFMTFYPEETLNMLAVLLDRDREFVDKLELDDSAKLFQITFEANLDFFVLRVLPLLSGGLERLTQKAAEIAKRLGGQRPPQS